MATKNKNYYLVTLAYIIVVTLIIGIGYYFYRSKIKLSQVAEISSSPTSLPVTGTFLIPRGVLATQVGIETYFQEISQNQIDTIVMMAIANISKNTDGSYIKSQIISDDLILSILKSAKQHNVKIYWGLVQSLYPNIQIWVGEAGDSSTDMGAVISYSKAMAFHLQGLATSNNIDWEDSSIAGFYITHENGIESFVDPNTIGLNFYKNISESLKNNFSTKKNII